jgi:hypothetical protein
MNSILSISYLGPVQYYSKFILCEKVLIEKEEHYCKQSYRNRCIILAANGLQTLVIPVLKDSGKKIKTKDIKIDNHFEWQKNHWRSIESAYNASPYFEFYKDDLAPFFNKKYNYLFDFDLELLNTMLELIKMNKNYILTGQYYNGGNNKYNDYREAIHPKKRMQRPDIYFKPKPYYQIFSERFAFKPNLSIIDLLFMEGPDTKSIIEQSIK